MALIFEHLDGGATRQRQRGHGHLEGRGEDIAVISKQLGHSTLATTADIYAHLTPAGSQRVADRMDAILRPAAGG